MAFSLGGLIGGVMKGAGEGYAGYAGIEMDKQAKIEYAEKLTQLQEEKDKRIAEFQSGLRLREAEQMPLAQAKGAKAAAPVAAQAKVEGETAEIDAAGAAGLPEKKAALTTRTLNAEAPNAELKASIEGKAAGKGQVAKTSVPGFLDSLAKEDYAKSSGERSVANISANAPKITPMGDGTYGVVVGGKLTSYLTDPKSGEKITGPKDLDTRTAKMVDALLLSAKADLDPDSRAVTVGQAIELLRGGGMPGTSAPPNSAIDALRKNPGLADQFDTKYGAGASKKYLPAQNTK